jgi:ketosteroid isomerase-like protein
METSEEIIIEKEKSALKKWCEGDTSGFVEIRSEEITYFDPYLEKRLDGGDAFKKYMDSINGTFNIFRFELLNPVVRIYGDVGVLTFNFISYSKDGIITSKWNGTEVYKKFEDDWKIIHSHWSLTKPYEK